VRENQEDETENKPNFGTLTLRRRKEEKEVRDQKMEQLKKKIKTDDECKRLRLCLSLLLHPLLLSIFIINIVLSIHNDDEGHFWNSLLNSL